MEGQVQSSVYKIVHNEGNNNLLVKLYEYIMMGLIFVNCSGFVYGSQVCSKVSCKVCSKALYAIE
jgi:hypothetical protein